MNIAETKEVRWGKGCLLFSFSKNWHLRSYLGYVSPGFRKVTSCRHANRVKRYICYGACEATQAFLISLCPDKIKNCLSWGCRSPFLRAKRAAASKHPCFLMQLVMNPYLDVTRGVGTGSAGQYLCAPARAFPRHGSPNPWESMCKCRDACVVSCTSGAPFMKAASMMDL